VSLFTLAPSRGPRWQIGVQAGLGIALPIAVMTLLGQPVLGYIAASGAFTVLFAAGAPVLERARLLPVIGVGLVISAALGVAAAPWPVLVSLGLVVVAIVSSALMFGYRVGPPGPIFFILVFGLSATVIRSGTVPPLVYVAAIAAGCLFSYAIALTPLLAPAMRAQPARHLRELLPGPAWDADTRMLMLRIAIVTVLGVLIGWFVDPGRTYWIVGAAVTVIGVVTARRVVLQRALHRMLGTLTGAGVYALLALLHPTGLWLALLLGTLQFSIELVIVRHYALALTLITPLVLLLVGAATGTLGDMAVATERIIDTLVGASLGALSAFLRPRSRA